MTLAVGIDPEHKDATFDTAVNASGTIDGFYIVEAANDRFIDVSFINSGYGWGVKTHQDKAVDVHFEEHYQDGEMRFDYRMRSGVMSRTNGLNVMAALGLLPK